MAIQTLRLAAFADEACVVEMDYDDADNRVRTIRCRNDTQLTAHGWVARADGSLRREADFPPGLTEIPVSTGAQQRLQLTPLAGRPGKWTGYDGGFSFPAA